ncbi:MAG: hypothetical protein M1833_004230 [Piccolia ochrophora]|nr:MAG: hypothetical protein M1833_004230 [Piccolia ochrophora]
MTMLKDNHIASHSSSIASAVSTAQRAGGFSTKVEVECRSLAEAREAVEAGADVVMLDNFSPEGAREAARTLKQEYTSASGANTAAGHRFLVEVSGGLNEGNVEGFVCEDIDVISTSSIHQSAPHVDFSLKIIQ